MTIIFDLDGTLALIEHRRHLVRDGKNRWDEFYRQCVNDEPNKPVIEACSALYSVGHEIVIFSGRSEVVRGETEEWLQKFMVPYHRLFMREEKDNTPDDVLKHGWLLTHIHDDVLCVFDDRQKVVDMWRANGIPCFQVAPGDF